MREPGLSAVVGGPHRLAGVLRYPVKSMGGEALTQVALDARGLVGDRWFAVVDPEGGLASGKTSRRFRRRDAVLEHRARTDAGGGVQVLLGERVWAVGDPALDAHLSQVTGADVRVLAEAGTPHQDSGQVSLVGTATLAWCARRWGGAAEPERVRANLVVETHEPFEEEAWVGRSLRLGTAQLDVVVRTPRCRMVDLVPGTAQRHASPWLRGLGQERDACVGLYLGVDVPGTVAVGDALTVL